MVHAGSMVRARRLLCKLALHDGAIMCRSSFTTPLLDVSNIRHVSSSQWSSSLERSDQRQQLSCCSIRSIFRSQRGILSGVGIHSSVLTRVAGIHVGRSADAPVEPSYGVGPIGGADRDPRSKGSTPDDGRADYIHMAEPKEITKEKAAGAQQEPPDFEVKKTMPQWQKPVEEKAEAQRDAGDKVFEGRTRKAEGTAEKQGTTTGNEKGGDDVQGQYGAAPSEGKTGRS